MGDEVMDEVDGWAGRAERIAVDGEQVALVDVGPDRSGGAPPLLVVHGFPTSSIDFAPVVGRLAAERRVVLVDLPGYGLSDKPDRAYSLFGQADVVEAVARDRGLSEVDLLTHDMGDSVGGELLARTIAGESPLQVRRRVLTNGSIYLDMAQLTDGQKFLRSLPDEMLPEGGGPDAEALAATLAALCAPTPPPAEAARHLRAGAELVVRAGAPLVVRARWVRAAPPPDPLPGRARPPRAPLDRGHRVPPRCAQRGVGPWGPDRRPRDGRPARVPPAGHGRDLAGRRSLADGRA